MFAEDSYLLFFLVPGAFISVAVGIWLGRKHPAACARFVLQCYSFPWWCPAVWALGWGSWAVNEFQKRRFVSASVFGALAGASVMSLVDRIYREYRKKNIQTAVTDESAGGNSSVRVNSP